MAQSIAHALMHIVFSTKNRAPLIANAYRDELYKYITGICKNIDCPLFAIGGMDDHIHIGLSLSRNVSISKLLEEIKRSSSAWFKKEHQEQFYWQNGYAAFSVSQSQKDTLINYIAQQETHHLKQDFKSELVTLLERHKADFHKDYLWD